MVDIRSTFKIGVASEVTDITSANLVSFPVNPASFNERISRTITSATQASFDGAWWSYANMGMNERSIIMTATITGTNSESDLDDLKEVCFNPNMKKLYIYGTTTGDSRYFYVQTIAFVINRSTSAPVQTIDVNMEFIAYDPCYYNDTEYTEAIDITAVTSVSVLTTSVSLTGKMGTADSFINMEIVSNGTAVVDNFSLADVDFSSASTTYTKPANQGDGFTDAVDADAYTGIGLSNINSGSGLATGTTFYISAPDRNENIRQGPLIDANPRETFYTFGAVQPMASRYGSTLPYTAQGATGGEFNTTNQTKLVRFRVENNAASQTVSYKLGGSGVGAGANKVTVTLKWKKRFW